MRTSVPRFHDDQGVFQADSCQPLIEASARGAVRLEAIVHGHYPGCKLPGNVLPGLKTAGFWDALEDQEWGLPWHRNEGIEICFLESGLVTFAADDSEFALHPNDMTITRPWQHHRVGNPNIGPSKLHWVIIDVKIRRPNQEWRWPSWLVLSPDDLSELSHKLRHTDGVFWHASSDLRRCFQSIAHAVEESKKGCSVSALAVRLNELLLLLLQQLRRQKLSLDEGLSSSRRTVELFLKDLRHDYEQLTTQWSVEQMAASCGLRVTQFVFHVRCLTNMTPMHYLSHCRLDYAAKLLLEFPERSVTDISLDCGFSSSQYFATVFGARFECSPKEFRRLHSKDTRHSERTVCA